MTSSFIHVIASGRISFSRAEYYPTVIHITVSSFVYLSMALQLIPFLVSWAGGGEHRSAVNVFKILA